MPDHSVNLVRSHWIPRKIHQEIRRGSENDEDEYEARNVPLPGAPLVRPEEHTVKKSSHHFLFFFLMISENSLKAAGRIVSTKRSKMYLPGSSLPR